jgi:hypothetical protein
MRRVLAEFLHTGNGPVRYRGQCGIAGTALRRFSINSTDSSNLLIKYFALQQTEDTWL